MKKHAAALLVLMLAGLTALVNAQVISPRTTARVPFEFIVNGKTMPAGECTITVQGDGVKSLWITSGSQSLLAIPIATQSANPNERTVFQFRRYGDRYFLASISRRGETTGYELPVQKMEAELRARNVTETDVLLLASHP